MEAMIDSAFVRLCVDAHVDRLPETRSDVQTLCQYFGMPQIDEYSVWGVAKELQKRAIECFQSGHNQARVLIEQIQNDLIYDYVLDQKPIDPYFAVLDHLKDALTGYVNTHDVPKNSEIEGDWKAALDNARDSTLVHDWTEHSLRERAHERVFHVAWAGRHLRTLNVKIIRGNNAVSLDEESDLKVANLIDETVRRLGGLNVAHRLFEQISNLYNMAQERYHTVRNVSMMGGSDVQVPIGYLMLLAEKHSNSRPRCVIPDQEWQTLCQLTTDYVALLNVQPYYPLVRNFIDPRDLARLIQEMAVYDSMFTLPQLRGSDLAGLIYGTLDGLDFDKEFKGGWSINEVVRVIETLVYLSKDTRGPVIFDRRRLQRLLPTVDHLTLQSILDDVLSHASGEVNKGYCQPLQVQSTAGHRTVITFPYRPLIMCGSRSYFWMDRSLCTPNCLEALFTPLRAVVRDFDAEQVGPAIERYLSQKFHRAGITCRSGTYAVGRQRRECDLIIESDDVILLFEIKKKPLTSRSRFGFDIDILTDLGGSVIAAINQSGWHEHELRKNGYIDLTNKDGDSYRLELRGRHVERIAVSLLDFGAFQDRLFINAFLNGIRPAKFRPVNSTDRDKLEKFNASIEELNQQIILLEGLGVDVKRPFFHCWFLSVPQILVVLDGVSGAEEFKKALWRTRHFSSGTSDFYHQHAYLTQLLAMPPDTTSTA